MSPPDGPDDFQIPKATVFADATPWRAFSDRPLNRPNPFWVMLHEVGHVLGILHTDFDAHGFGGRGCGGLFVETIMDCCDRQGRDINEDVILTVDVGTLELDDMAAATALYPKWRYRVRVEDRSGNPIVAAVWLHRTCFPQEGDNEDLNIQRQEGGMVFGDITWCLNEIANSEGSANTFDSPTYHPEITYVTAEDQEWWTGWFRVMHNTFGLTVVAGGYADSTGTQGELDDHPDSKYRTNHIETTVVMNKLPVCNANGPYTAECQGATTTLQLNGTASDPEGDSLTYQWSGAFAGGTASGAAPTVTFSGTGVFNLILEVTDDYIPNPAKVQCRTTVTIEDTTPPDITCPAEDDIEIECDQWAIPGITGSATAVDVCDPDPDVTFTHSETPGSCPGQSTITRTWVFTDASGNISDTCTQNITVVDITPPVIACNAPVTIIPPAAPISFTATATDNCSDPGDITVEIIDFDCYKFTKKGKKLDMEDNRDCQIQVNGDTITILESVGVGMHIEWTVRATDECGNVSSPETCDVLVIKP